MRLRSPKRDRSAYCPSTWGPRLLRRSLGKWMRRVLNQTARWSCTHLASQQNSQNPSTTRPSDPTWPGTEARNTRGLRRSERERERERATEREREREGFGRLWPTVFRMLLVRGCYLWSSISIIPECLRIYGDMDAAKFDPQTGEATSNPNPSRL